MNLETTLNHSEDKWIEIGFVEAIRLYQIIRQQVNQNFSTHFDVGTHSFISWSWLIPDTAYRYTKHLTSEWQCAGRAHWGSYSASLSMV